MWPKLLDKLKLNFMVYSIGMGRMAMMTAHCALYGSIIMQCFPDNIFFLLSP